MNRPTPPGVTSYNRGHYTRHNLSNMTVLRVNTGEYTSTIGIYPGYNHKTLYLPVDGHKISPISRECVSLSPCSLHVSQNGRSERTHAHCLARSTHSATCWPLQENTDNHCLTRRNSLNTIMNNEITVLTMQGGKQTLKVFTTRLHIYKNVPVLWQYGGLGRECVGAL